MVCKDKSAKILPYVEHLFSSIKRNFGVPPVAMKIFKLSTSSYRVFSIENT